MHAASRAAPPPFPFVCPACAAPQTTDLLLLARRGAVSCTACGRRLTSTHVMRARQAPRKPVAASPDAR